MSKTETLYPLSTVGGRIQYLRRQQGLRREELHELIAEKEISRVYTDNPESKYRTVKGWESGETAPSLEQINAMCDIFGCSADYLLGRMEEKTHDAHFVCEYTGLTEKAAEILHEKNISNDYVKYTEIRSICHLLEYDLPEEGFPILSIIDNYTEIDDECKHFRDKNGEYMDVPGIGICSPDRRKSEMMFYIQNRLNAFVEKLKKAGVRNQWTEYFSEAFPDSQ